MVYIQQPYDTHTEKKPARQHKSRKVEAGPGYILNILSVKGVLYIDHFLKSSLHSSSCFYIDRPQKPEGYAFSAENYIKHLQLSLIS